MVFLRASDGVILVLSAVRLKCTPENNKAVRLFARPCLLEPPDGTAVCKALGFLNNALKAVV